MNAFARKIVLALIAAAAAIAPTIIERNNKPSLNTKPTPAPTSTNSSNPADPVCDKVLAAKACIVNLTVQINSDQPLQVNNHKRIPLKAGAQLLYTY